MIVIEKVLTAVLKNISTALYTIGAGSASELLRKYSIAKINYYYSKARKDIEE